MNNQPSKIIEQKQIGASINQNDDIQSERKKPDSALIKIDKAMDKAEHNLDDLEKQSIKSDHIVDESDKKTCRTLWEKIKTMKNYQIFVALVIAVVIIIIYFSVNAIIAKPKTQNVTKGGSQSQLEKVLSQIEGVGFCNIVITYNKNGSIHQSNEIEDNVEIYGVVVVAEGGDNVYVKIKLTDALCALLKLKDNNIKIYKSK